MADGHLSFCKQCTRDRVLYYREANLDRIREYDRKRGRRKSLKPYSKFQKNAANKLNNAISQGLISRKPCVICGKQKSEGHHFDYKKPLAVIWLCSVHHKMLHHKKLSLLPINFPP